ncbi:tRNA pseudouridine(38-40) synthase TruA [Heliophilum fasciatum]|uniref:tRNA pseudouridine synthase A n=1 Tax=Heliophilum fasciatum TaxID=35700 RepID=A0A4R2RNG8_9FIRM|nr:tRNA pseudouridine(38-40) synthase TruA [Heliophilum fasciatum]MCW2277783.1 tRNA pseudouridine38-40 synthase [Heliophilum fasciatum]TCP64723.1 tRNA pseudouridine38-40 synthase [Heliophilum fasciatum]
MNREERNHHPARKVRFVVMYDGTHYHGFQTQEDSRLPTIQDQLHHVIQTLTGESVKIICAGRTDAGVHARGQVVDFSTSSRIPDERFPLAMNALLPRDITVIQAETVHPDFHARFDALGKHYRYTIYNRRMPSPFQQRYSYQVFPELDLERMRAAAAALIGTHHFGAFCASGSVVKRLERTIWRCTLTPDEEGCIHIDVMGDGFLYNMVRIIAGTLIDVGKGKIDPRSMPEIIASRDRTQAGTTAPPRGLCLMKVWYTPQPVMNGSQQ